MTSAQSHQMRSALCVVASAVALCAAIGGCSARRPVSPTPEGALTPPDVGGLTSARDRARLAAIAAERAGAADASGYRIGPDDLLEVRIADLLDVQSPAAVASTSARIGVVAPAPSFQQGLRVDAAGDIAIPLLGTVRAADLTASALEAKVARQLSTAGILCNPQVSVLIAEYRSRVIAVVGSVERPGLYPLTRPGATVADLIWAAGGPNRDAGRLVAFVPASAGTPVISGAAPDLERLAPGNGAIRMDLETLLHGARPDSGPTNPPVRPGDLLSVAPAGSVQVGGWVGKPGSYPVTRGLTLSGAVAAAGGSLFAADRGRVTVKRVLGPGEERQFKVDLERVMAGEAPDMPIADGDVVNLPASASRMVPYAAWEVVRSLVQVGGSVPLF